MATSCTSVSTSDALTLHLDGPGTGTEHMRRDTELLRRCARGDIAGVVRVYWFEPACLSLGRLQPETDVDMAACARDGVDVVRRPSGGRAVLHDGEVTYAVVCRVNDPDLGGGVLDACARIHRHVACGLALLGVQAQPRARGRGVRRDALEGAGVADCFARPAAHELLDVDGHKLVGSAQARLGGALLQHGTVMLDAPHAARYLRNAAANRGAGGLRWLAGRAVRREELALALAGGFAQGLGRRLARPLDTTL